MVWYSLLVLSSVSCPLYLDSRVWMVATSASIFFRSVWLSASRAFTAATAAVACSSRVASASWTRGDLGDTAACGLYLRVELLKPDQMLDIGVHVGI